MTELTREQQVAKARYLLSRYKARLAREAKIEQEIRDGIRHECGLLIGRTRTDEELQTIVLEIRSGVRDYSGRVVKPCRVMKNHPSNREIMRRIEAKRESKAKRKQAR